jgi:hypothetical protein
MRANALCSLFPPVQTADSNRRPRAGGAMIGSYVTRQQLVQDAIYGHDYRD